MNYKVTIALITAVALVIVVLWAVYVLRGAKLKSGKVKVGNVSAEVGTHGPDKHDLKNIEQNAAQGSNEANLRGDNISVDGLKQTAKKDNTLNIGNP